jgi:hypothetical protein
LLDIVEDSEAAEAERALLDGQPGQGIDPSVQDERVDTALSDRVGKLESRASTVETRVGVPCQVVVATGEENPATTTLRAAEAANCDLIAAPYESDHGALTTYLRQLLSGDMDVVVHRSADDRTQWRRVLVPVRRASDVAHHMVDFAGRLSGQSGHVAVASCISRDGDRRRAESMLANIVEPFEGNIETRVSQSDIRSFLRTIGPQYDLVIMGASQDRSAASRFIAPPTFEQVEDIDTDVAIVDRG